MRGCPMRGCPRAFAAESCRAGTGWEYLPLCATMVVYLGLLLRLTAKFTVDLSHSIEGN